MNTADVQETLYKLFIKPEKAVNIFLQGGPGVGKTSIVAQAAKKAKKNLITFALPTCEAVDLRGIPHVVDGKTVWASPLPRTGEGVLLLDEVSSAPPDVQVAAHHLIWAEEGSDMSLPKGWHVVLTGNRVQDKTLYRSMSGPLRNRLATVQCQADVAQWAH